MAARVSPETAGPSYASVLNFRGSDSNKENIEAREEPGAPVPADEEEGFVPVVGHTRRATRGRRERRAPSRPAKTPAPHVDQPHSASDQSAQQSQPDQPKKFVEAPIPKVNPWQVNNHTYF